MFYTNFFLRGDYMYLRYVDDDGKHKKSKIGVDPVLYLPDQNSNDAKTVYGDNLHRFSFDTVREARQFVDTHSDTEGNSRAWGFTRFDYNKIDEMFPGQDGVEYDYDKIRTIYFDIECETTPGEGFANPDDALERINVITAAYNGKYFVFHGDQRINSEYIKSKIDSKIDVFVDDINCVFCKDERTLLSKFVAFWTHIEPDIVSGWNSQIFDVPYLVNRIHKVLGENAVNSLSPWGIVKKTETTLFNKKKQTVFNIAGVASIDYMELYKKYKLKMMESYKLDFIASTELGYGKLDTDDFDVPMHLIYRQDYPLFVAYNVQDVALLCDMENNLSFMRLAAEMAYMTKVNYVDVMKNMRIWETVMTSYLREQNIMVPSKVAKSDAGQYEGAYVREPLVGYYDWVASFDLTSLYPSLIIQYNISPETLYDGESFLLTANDFLNQTDAYQQAFAFAKENNLTLACNGAMYSRDSIGFVPALADKYFEERKKSKNKAQEYKDLAESCKDENEKQKLKTLAKQWDLNQKVKKVAINALYGCLGSVMHIFYNAKNATAITVGGQVAARWVGENINQYLQRVTKTGSDFLVSGDTDSLYLNLTLIAKIKNDHSGKMSESKTIDFIDVFCQKKIQPVISQSYERMAEMTNAYSNRMDMKREAIGKAVFTQKKRYVIKLYDDEGVRLAKPKIKVTGLESMRSTIPKFCRDEMVKIYTMIFDEPHEKILKEIARFKKEFVSTSFVTLAGASSANNLDKYTGGDGKPVKGAPYHVKGAIHYNQLLDQHGLSERYERIGEGDKVRVLPLKKMNPCGSSAISFKEGGLPKEFGLDEYIDIAAQYDKCFFQPIDRVMEAMGKRAKAVQSLDEFF